MTKQNIIILILAIVIILTILFIIIYKTYKERLDNIINKLNDSEDECFENLKSKYELLTKLIKNIESKYKVESKVFEDVKKINIESINSFKDEKMLNKCYKEINHIIEDNPKIKPTKTIKDLLTNYDENELHIISLRTFHNKYTLVYNNTIKKIPYNIISKIKRYKLKTLIEGKELDTNFNNNLDV